MLFQEKKRALGLYNAASGKQYTDPEKLEVITLENAIYMGMKNDLAFLIDCHLYLFEHQSTINKNMPFRFLQYVERVRAYVREMPIGDAVDRAVDECIEQGILTEQFCKHPPFPLHK